MYWKRKKLFRLQQAGPLALFTSAQLWESSVPDIIKMRWAESWEKLEKL
jgi:hypothetical protein